MAVIAELKVVGAEGGEALDALSQDTQLNRLNCLIFGYILHDQLDAFGNLL